MKKKRNWKFYFNRTLLTLLVIVGIWLTNLIWFRPFNINHFYDRIFVEMALDDPELVTTMGIPFLYDKTKDELTDASDERNWIQFNKIKQDYATLKSYNYNNQTPVNQLNTRILGWYLKSLIDGEPYFYHDYPVNQMFGEQSNLPSFLENAHKIRNESDVAAYISRLSKFKVKFDQVLEGLSIREQKGIIPPKFVITRVLDEMRGFCGQLAPVEGELEKNPDPIRTNILYSNLASKIDSIHDLTANEKLEYLRLTEEEIQNTVFPAYQKLIDYFEGLYPKATTDDGVWKFPDGDHYYAYQLKQYTTTDLNPEEVYQIGLSEVERIKKEMWAVLKSEGYIDTVRSIGAVIQDINKEERFLFPDDDTGREMILVEYQRILEEISSSLDDAFDVRPKATLEVRRVPAFKEAGSAGAYYSRPAMDGSRGGTFFANLRDVHETVRLGMKTLAYHEGIPGHHFQIAIQSELEDVPIFRTIGLFTAYIEGWALYTEQLAWELGFYEGDPYGNLGRLQAEMMRAVRLVVDTGIHFKKWTREEAIEYMARNTGMATSEVVTEIERYIVMPGQACAYKIGMLKILELREMAKRQLGADFDLREFHNVVLKNGAVPLDILEEIIDAYIAEVMKENN